MQEREVTGAGSLSGKCASSGGRLETRLLVIDEDKKDLASSEEKEEADFWLKLTERAFKKIWDNPQDDVYNKLLDQV
jgi:hypothetical protein